MIEMIQVTKSAFWSVAQIRPQHCNRCSVNARSTFVFLGKSGRGPKEREPKQGLEVRFHCLLTRLE